jgi:hypothetical protein
MRNAGGFAFPFLPFIILLESMRVAEKYWLRISFCRYLFYSNIQKPAKRYHVQIAGW